MSGAGERITVRFLLPAKQVLGVVPFPVAELVGFSCRSIMDIIHAVGQKDFYVMAVAKIDR